MQNNNLVHLLLNSAQRWPEQIAYRYIVDGESQAQCLTYQQLHDRALSIAAVLRDTVKPGERVLLLYPPGLEFICAFFGCLCAGVIAVPAYPPNPHRLSSSLARLEVLLQDADPALILSTKPILALLKLKQVKDSFFNYLQKVGRSPRKGLFLNAIKKVNSEKITTQTDLQAFYNGTTRDLLYLQYTSGSTGNPKGVMLDHDCLLSNLNCLQKIFNFDVRQKLFGWIPLFHDLGMLLALMPPVAYGCETSFISPLHYLEKPIRWFRLIDRYRSEVTGGPCSGYAYATKKIKAEDCIDLDLSCIRYAGLGGEPIRPHTLSAFAQKFSATGFEQKNFVAGYGLAEATVSISASRAQQGVSTVFHDDDPQHAIASVGHVIPGHDVLIVDQTSLMPCQGQQVGEIWFKGPSVTRGYWRNPEATDNTFNAYTADGQGPFLRTGDLGFFAEQQLCVSGRLKDLVIIRGRNYVPQDIEYAVEDAHESIRKSCVAAFSYEEAQQEKLVIIAELKRTYRKKNYVVIIEAIKKAVASENQLNVSAIRLLPAGKTLKTTSGKIQRQAIKQAFLADRLTTLASWDMPANVDLEGLFATPPNDLESIRQQLKAWVSIRLNTDVIDTTRSLLDLGLDSLLSVEAADFLSRWLAIPINPAIFWEYASIDSLSEHLAVTIGVFSPIAATPQMTQPRIVPTVAEDIAIVSVACRLPGAKDVEQFWQNLLAGIDSITEVPASRWDISQYYSPVRAQGKMTSRYGGFLQDIDQFDASFFNITATEAKNLDPQQRILLEVMWQGLERAGINAHTLAKANTGIFVGASSQDYAKVIAKTVGIKINGYVGVGNALSALAGRLAYTLGTTGITKVIDTACSSSLVAVEEACVRLNRGDCDLALAAGVNIMLDPDITIVLSQARMMAKDGRCKVFSHDADGYVRSEGCGVVVLKRLADALRDQDPICAVIKGSAVNQDGASNGLTAPSGRAQQALIKQSLTKAALQPTDIDFVECHGTGTALGDPIECRALQAVYGVARTDPLQLGALKSNIGHCEAAAGIAGLIKLSLCLYHKTLPKNLHLEHINENIASDCSNLSFLTEKYDWPQRPHRQRIGAVSSFGFTGSNAHVIVAEAPELLPRDKSRLQRPLHLLVLSAKCEASLQKQVEQYQRYLTSTQHQSTPLGDITYTASVGRAHFDYRLAVIGHDKQSLVEQLSKKTTQFAKIRKKPSLIKAFILYTANIQAVNSTEIEKTHPLIQCIVDDCCDYYVKTFHHDLKADGFALPRNRRVLAFILGYAQLMFLQRLGITPDLIIGDSLGEVLAAVITGVFSLEDGLHMIADATYTKSITYQLPQGKLISHITKQAFDQQQLQAEYWLTCSHDSTLPLPTLKKTIDAYEHDLVLELACGNNDWQNLLTTLATCYLSGIDIDWQQFDQAFAWRKVTLPTYPFQKERYWIGPTQDVIDDDVFCANRTADGVA